MASSIYLLQVVIGGMDGKSQMSIPVRAFASKETANEALRLRTDVLRMSLGCHLFDEQGDTGVSVAAFLKDFGLHGFTHVVDTVNVHEGGILAPKKSEILTPQPPSIIIAR